MNMQKRDNKINTRTAPQRLRATVSRCLMLLFVLMAFTPNHATARENAVIDDFIVTNSDTHLLLYLMVKNCFTEKMEVAVRNGIPATFTFFVDIYKIRKAWPDRKLISHTFHHTLSYDSLKEEYRVDLSEKAQQTTTDDLATAKQLMADITGFKAIQLSSLTQDAKYRLRVKAKLAEKTLPLNFHYLIPFSSLWDFETDWYSLEFTY